MKYALIRITDAADWQVYHAIRRSSLWEERGLDGYDDARPQEHFTHHHALLLKLDEEGIGTTRLDDLRDGTGIVRLVAITAPLRRLGHGRVLVTMVEDYARKIELGRLYVSAASDAEGFYTATGWTRLTTEAPELLGYAESCAQMTKSIA
jgi:N-acetylglutamate synthase-like GNAT family acetyltransferase